MNLPGTKKILLNDAMGHYASMINDKWRNQFFHSALQQKAKDKVVLDVGSGTGILSFFALAAGAKFVYSIEYDPLAVLFTEQILKKNFAADRFKVINGNFWTEDLSSKIQHPIDILVSETIGPGLFDQGMIQTWSTILPFLATDAISIPDRLHLDLWVYEGEISQPLTQKEIFVLYPSEMIESDFAKSLLEVDEQIYYNSDKAKMSWVEINQIQQQPKNKHVDIISYSMKDKPILKTVFSNRIPEINFEIYLESNLTIALVNKISFENTTLYIKDALQMPWKLNPVFSIEHAGIYNIQYTNLDLRPMSPDEWTCTLKS